MERPGISPAASGDKIEQIMRMVQNGDEPRRIFASIAECATNTPGVQSCALYLPSDKPDVQEEVIAQHGEFPSDEDISAFTDRSGRAALQPTANSYHRSESGSLLCFDVVCLGAPIGSLIVTAPEGLSQVCCEKITYLAHYAGIVFERQRLSTTLQHFLDRLQVLNELNQLIASNVGLTRIVKSLARESAFRFAADIALAFLINEERTKVTLKGGYGCTPNAVPTEIELDTGILGQVMRLGGHFSISNIRNQTEHGLDFLEPLEIRAVDVCCLEVRGEPLGVIVIGYRRGTVMSQNDLTRFEEFAQGAAVAIANARTQERITAYTERLQDLVDQRTSDLAVQTQRAEEANKAKSQFLANMSHELRTPLTAIVGYSSVLADGLFGEMNDKQTDALNAITRSSEHLKNLIDDVLNLARIESGKEVPEPTRVMISEVLEQSYKLMLQTATGKNVTLRKMEIPENLAKASLFVDAKHMQQIIINVMSNAVKYTPPGGDVWLETEVVVDKVKIAVHDTGVGISAAKMETLFERFERGEDTYSKDQEGTGIGLNLTRRLVELNGGRIGVESEEGKGSTFWIVMPIAHDDAQSPTQTEQKTSRARLDGLSTLVVDDNRDTCEVLRQILAAAGASVTTAHTVREGIELLDQSVPDIVLTDLAMPGESGLVLIEYIRNSSGPTGSLPVMVLSACAFENDREAAMNAGASAFMPKPFKPSEVLSHVRELTLSLAMQGSGKV